MANQFATLVTTQSFQTDPPFHSQILQTRCLALPYMSQNFFLEHIKAKGTVHDSAVMTEKMHVTGIENLRMYQVRPLLFLFANQQCFCQCYHYTLDFRRGEQYFGKY